MTGSCGWVYDCMASVVIHYELYLLEVAGKHTPTVPLSEFHLLLDQACVCECRSMVYRSVLYE